jgi:hypothetical protein
VRRILAFVLLAAFAAACSKKDEDKPQMETHDFRPTTISRAYVAMIENPNANRVLLIGEEARRCEVVFRNAGVEPSLTIDGKYDLVVMACDTISPESLRKVRGYMTATGVLAWMVDVNGVTAAKFKKMLESFSLADSKLWMVGEKRWLVTGRNRPTKIYLEDMLEIFAREGAVEDLVTAKCPSLATLLAGYAGMIKDIMPAFDGGNLSAEVRPEFFLTRNIPSIEWVSASGLDEDIAGQMEAQYMALQKERRNIVEGNILAEAGKEKEAIEKWSAAAAKSPADLFILERLDRLDRNARGFVEVGKILMAMKCFETMVLIKPNDAVAVHNFGMCLQKFGRGDLAKKVFARAKELTDGKAKISPSPK